MANSRKPWLAAYRFQPGQSGNPSGRAKDAGVVTMVRRRCGQHGAKLVEGLYLLAFGTADERNRFFGEPVTVSAKDRRDCIELLLERGFGKVADEVDVHGAPNYVFVYRGIPPRPGLPEGTEP